MGYRAAIFDLDGTILDTVEDLRLAMNYAMEKTGHRHDYTADDAKLFFGSGPREAIKRALTLEAGWGYDCLLDIGTEKERIPESVTTEEVLRIFEIYSPFYNAHNEDHTGPYPGVIELLARLKDAGITLAVVSNKPDVDTQKLINKMFPGCFDLIGGQREGIRRKPFPDMTDHAIEELGVERSETVYIGDSEIDFQTAVNSGLDCISVTWGFRSEEYVNSLGAKYVAATPEEVYGIICGEQEDIQTYDKTCSCKR
ncbi:MAG: HAD family hydrolase [Lachnospiraceae bacterium]|nr:HAD family hydrolase [Lachnospiraceae bacterium]